MYAEFYSLSSLPFQSTPDSRFFFASAEHNRAMAFVHYGISQGEGLIVITGEVGAGKTTLVDHVLSTLDPARYVAGRIFTTQLDSDDMLRMVGASFHIFREGMDKATLLTHLKQFADDLQRQNRRALLIVDEAQNLSNGALEALRMLCNLVVSGATPLQSILVGQPEFRASLARPDLEQMRQRVTASCHLGPLSVDETRLYVEHRLNRVGWRADPTISDQAFIEVYRLTGGIPRRINTLFSRILLLGFLEEKHHIDEHMVVGVGDELASELGLLEQPQDIPSIPDGNSHNGHDMRDLRDDIASRLLVLERKLDQQERTLNRVLDIVANHQSSLKS
jgi:putative secretion ATPase (PEP-CTERM system associated)